jgi:hypothetical protein
MTTNRGDHTDWEELGLFEPMVNIVNSHNLGCTMFACKLASPKAGIVKWTKHASGFCEHDVGRSLLVGTSQSFLLVCEQPFNSSRSGVGYIRVI